MNTSPLCEGQIIENLAHFSFKCDENSNDFKTFVEIYNGKCHSVQDENLRGKPDSLLAKRCFEENRILLTRDSDFCHPNIRSKARVIFVQTFSKIRGEVVVDQSPALLPFVWMRLLGTNRMSNLKEGQLLHVVARCDRNENSLMTNLVLYNRFYLKAEVCPVVD